MSEQIISGNLHHNKAPITIKTHTVGNQYAMLNFESNDSNFTTTADSIACSPKSMLKVIADSLAKGETKCSIELSNNRLLNIDHDGNYISLSFGNEEHLCWTHEELSELNDVGMMLKTVFNFAANT